MKTQGQMINHAVESIMSDHVVTVMPQDSAKEAVRLMIDNELTTIPVVDISGLCIGILSRSDLTELFLEGDAELNRMMNTPMSMERLYGVLETCEERTVNELMTIDVRTLNKESSVLDLCKLMIKERVHHVPIVDDAEQVVGLVSSMDVVNAVANSGE